MELYGVCVRRHGVSQKRPTMKEHRTSGTVILVLSFSRGVLQLGEEFVDLVPDVFAAG
jgi:hypothetical protein